MAKFTLKILPAALAELLEIKNWYILHFTEKAANKVIFSILESINRLQDFPDLCSLTPDEWLNKKGYRMVICEKHIAICRKVENEIFIYHIFDARRQYVKLFKEFGKNFAVCK